MCEAFTDSFVNPYSQQLQNYHVPCVNCSISVPTETVTVATKAVAATGHITQQTLVTTCDFTLLVECYSSVLDEWMWYLGTFKINILTVNATYRKMHKHIMHKLSWKKYCSSAAL